MLKRIVILIIITSCLFAQLQYEFTHLAHYQYGENSLGFIFDVDVSPNKTIFFADYLNGLIAYEYNSESGALTKITQIKEDGASYNHVDVMNDSTIFIIDRLARLICYSFRDNSLSKISELYAADATGINAVNDSTVLLCCGENGLKVIHFNGTDLSVIAEDDREGAALQAEMLNDSTLLLANGTEGLYAYHYGDSTLEYISRIISAGSRTYLEYASDVKITHDGTIFLANGEKGLYAYTFNDSTFIYHASIGIPFISLYERGSFSDIEIGINDNTIYVAGGEGGLYVYQYSDLSFSKIDNKYGDYVHALAKIYDNMLITADGNKGARIFSYSGSALNLYDRIVNDIFARRLDFDRYGRIFLANGGAGIQAYEFDGTEFICLTQTVYNTGYAKDIAVTSDGLTVFVANGRSGLNVYSFNGNEFSLIGCYKPGEGSSDYYGSNNINSVELIGENKILYTHKISMTDYNSNKSYSFGTAQTCIWNGSAFTDTSLVFVYPSYEMSQYSGGLVSDAAFVNEDSVVVGLGNDGIATYTNELNTGGYVQDADILPDGTILTANSTAGLKTYNYVSDFILQDSINNGGSASNVLRFPDGTLLLANGNDGLRSYTYDDEFTCTGHINNGGSAQDVIVLPDSTIIIANGEDGLRAYAFNGFQSAPDAPDDPDNPNDPTIPASFKLYQNYPNPFNPTTTLRYYMLKKADARITIYDVFGKQVREWFFENNEQGFHYIKWDGKNENHQPVPNGIYIYQLAVRYYDLYLDSRKMVVLK